MSQNRRSKGNRVMIVGARYVISFLLALDMTVMLILSMLAFSFTNKDVILGVFSQDAYCEEVRDFIVTTGNKVTYTVGITEEELYGDDLSIDRIREQAVAYASAALENEFYLIDIEKFQQDIYDNILDYMADRGFEESESNLKSAMYLAQTVTGYYQNGVEFPAFGTFASICRTISGYMVYALAGGSVLAIILIVLLFMLCRRKYHGAKFIIYSIISAMLNILVPVGYLYFSRVYTRITITTGFIKYFITEFCDTCIHRLGLFCLIFVPVIIVLLVWEGISHKKAVEKDSRHGHHHRRQRKESENA